MIVKDYIGEMLEGENSFTNRGKTWDVSTLRLAAENLEVFELDLMSIDISTKPWRFDGWDIHTYLFHALRVEKADLQYPIILNESGYIIDGWHRVVKAIMNGNSTIKAVRFKVMPEADAIENGE